ncbi:E3 binding domain-containing protein [Deinococcus sp. Leaf326]|uniref:E3 binding domain-containing protein n=1 Tax=Deinococcus sp. Leaf326 TaxID=1736338 RepID=UPI0006F54BA0|nr:E3 binding domain-containing protein [Deinococcus sp. Leaf326]KQQ97803.1 hypothetical protein ASF71_14360 [Deinococcus sp. Leaf326]
MERIAPLAKILAEANGIEWQGLHGSGEGGQIVEQDILDYLTRVMSGEADPPSTPVDAPPPDWNGEDIPGGGMFDASALSRAGVDTDIAQFVEQSRVPTPATPVQSGPVSAASDFELDDGEEDLLLPPAPQPAAPVAPVMAAAPAPAAGPVLGRAGSAPVPPAAHVPSTPAPAPAPAPAGGLGNLLSRLYQKPAAAPEPAAPPAPVMSAPEVVARAVPEPVSTPAEPAPVVPAPVVTEPVVAQPVIAEPVPVAAPVVAAPAPEVSAPVPTPEVAAPVQPAYTPPAPVQPMPAPVVPPVAAPVQPAPAQHQPSAAQPPRDAVWFGTYLRREANVTGLMDLHGQLSEALGREVPLALLLARAAQHHAAALGLDTLAIQDVQASRVRTVQSGSLREALAGLDGDFGGTPDLLIVDAGTLDLDDLHYPHTLSLSIGRVQGGRVGLSLQGNVEPDKAARFLAGVAQTLEKPVILLV